MGIVAYSVVIARVVCDRCTAEPKAAKHRDRTRALNLAAFSATDSGYVRPDAADPDYWLCVRCNVLRVEDPAKFAEGHTEGHHAQVVQA